MRSTNMNIRIDPYVKENADAIFNAIGISMSDGINIFLKRVIAEEGFPFDVKAYTPNAETLQAMQEAKEITVNPNSKAYHSVDELFEDLDDEV